MNDEHGDVMRRTELCLERAAQNVSEFGGPPSGIIADLLCALALASHFAGMTLRQVVEGNDIDRLDRIIPDLWDVPGKDA